MVKYKVSIVTPTFNQGEFIEQTIDSVLSQDYPQIEYVLIDGGSSDNTVEIIKKYQKHLKYWVSEPDTGQVHAINKGLKQCSGEIFNWLNSDDYLEQGAIKAIVEGFADGADLVAGGVRVFEKDKTIENVRHSKLSAKGLLFWEPGVQFVQPGVWMRRELIGICGGIDESFHFAFDWDLYIRYMSKFSNIKVIDDLLVHFRFHDNSKTVSMQQKFKLEEQTIIEKLSLIEGFNSLNKTANFKAKLNRFMPYYKQILNDDSYSNLYKIKSILGTMSKENLVLWRVAAGAMKMALLNKKFADE